MSNLKVMYFSAPWCGPCKVFKPAFNEVVDQYDDIDVQRIDIDDTPIFAQEYLITSIPTIIIMKGEEKIFRQSGVMSKLELKNLIDANR